jgi:hypothetical protein
MRLASGARLSSAAGWFSTENYEVFQLCPKKEWVAAGELAVAHLANGG